MLEEVAQDVENLEEDSKKSSERAKKLSDDAIDLLAGTTSAWRMVKGTVGAFRLYRWCVRAFQRTQRDRRREALLPQRLPPTPLPRPR